MAVVTSEPVIPPVADETVIPLETSKPKSKRMLQMERIAARREQVVQLRRLGLEYKEIGQRLGCDGKTAWNDMQTALRMTIQEPTDEVRQIELLRLNTLWMHAMSIVLAEASTPDVKMRAISTCLSIMSRRALLEGLDAPKKVDMGPWLERFAAEQGLDTADVFEAAKEIVAGMGF